MRQGFTLLELLLVLAIFVVVSVTIYANLAGRSSETQLTATAQEVATMLRQAQSDAVAQASDVAWGVHFANTTTSPSYALFTGSYSTSTTVGYYVLPPTVAYKTSTLASGATLDIIFSPITGVSSVSTSIGFYLPGKSAVFSSTISVASSGAVIY